FRSPPPPIRSGPVKLLRIGQHDLQHPFRQAAPTDLPLPHHRDLFPPDPPRGDQGGAVDEPVPVDHQGGAGPEGARQQHQHRRDQQHNAEPADPFHHRRAVLRRDPQDRYRQQTGPDQNQQPQPRRAVTRLVMTRWHLIARQARYGQRPGPDSNRAPHGRGTVTRLGMTRWHLVGRRGRYGHASTVPPPPP